MERRTIAQAAHRLGLSYDQVRRLLLRGDLEGGQDDEGKWYVSELSLANMLRAESSGALT